MTILIAEDDPISRRLLQTHLERWGHAVTAAADGAEAWRLFEAGDFPIVISDWMMPEMDGLELTRRMRASSLSAVTYILLVTGRAEKDDIISGLESGANDYVTKPFDQAELRARVSVGARVVELQQRLAERVKELEEALSHVKQLQGILPICSYCKKVRDDDKYWQRVEDYISAHSDVGFSHSICPECWETVLQPEMEKMWGCKIPYEE